LENTEGGDNLGHVHDGTPVAHHQVARVVNPVAQTGQQWLAEFGQLQRRQVLEAQAQHRHAQAVFVAAAGDEAHGFQGGQQAENRRARQRQAPRQFRRGQGPVAPAELAEQQQAALQARHDVFVLSILQQI
jgi:hypothetical protein